MHRDKQQPLRISFALHGIYLADRGFFPTTRQDWRNMVTKFAQDNNISIHDTDTPKEIFVSYDYKYRQSGIYFSPDYTIFNTYTDKLIENFIEVIQLEGWQFDMADMLVPQD